MKLQMKLMILAALMVLAAASAGYAEAEGGNTAVNAVGQILKAPFTLLHKAGDSLQDSNKASGPSEDVAVSDVYDLDAETTG